MPKLKIVFLDASTVDLGDVSLQSIRKQGVYYALFQGAYDTLPKIALDADVLITNKFILGEKEFKKLPQLKLVCIAATGTNNIDLQASRARGIAVSNVAGYSTTTVVEHTLGFLLYLSHRLGPHDAVSRSKKWSSAKHFAYLALPFSDLAGKTLGVVGCGHIGRRVASLAKGFGMRILVAKIPGRKYSKAFKRFDLREVLQKSDFVSLHCALSEKTRYLIDLKNLRLMKKTAYLLNLARGDVVVEKDVAKALQDGVIAGYATDVMSQEPPPTNHPLLKKSLANKVLITPHIAWASRESRQRLVDEIAGNIASFKKGGARNRVV